MAETHAEAAPFLLFLCSFFPTSLSPGRLRQADSQDDFFFFLPSVRRYLYILKLMPCLK